jgi:hypothetical protein
LLQEQAVRRVAMQHEAAESIAADLIRALRGRRSRAAFSKRLGYRSNVVYRWETGLAWPPADELLEALARRNPQLNGLFVRFLGRSPSWLDPTAPLGATSVAAFLRELRGKTPIAALSARSGYSRFSIGRWLHGRARPRLPELLCLVEAASRRALDLLALLTDPAHMPTVAPRWRQLCVARETAYEAPWSHAVLRASTRTRRPDPMVRQALACSAVAAGRHQRRPDARTKAEGGLGAHCDRAPRDRLARQLRLQSFRRLARGTSAAARATATVRTSDANGHCGVDGSGMRGAVLHAARRSRGRGQCARVTRHSSLQRRARRFAALVSEPSTPLNPTALETV